jgi:hypothetical protein
MTELCPGDPDCVLLGTVDTQTAYNQDRLNFLYTTLIGGVVVVAGLLTLSQALTASARLKASASAIGHYAKRTRTTFDLKDMKFYTTARVPCIELGEIVPSDIEKLVLSQYDFFLEIPRRPPRG